MKIIRYGAPGQERPGLIDAQGVLRDLSSLLPDWGPSQLHPETVAAMASLDPSGLPTVPSSVRLGCPLAGVGKIVCVGLNYADHAREAGMQPPSEPVLFMKAATALAGPHDPLVLPPGATKTDWEVELGVVIGQRAYRVSREQALSHVAGYVLANDVSERSWQMERGGQWDKGKSHDGFAPLGPWVATPDELPDPHTLDVWLELNGQRMQDGTTRNFIFDIPTVLAYITQFMTLAPGDVVLTGTPAGVGLGQKPAPRFLQAGDVLRLGATGLGEQRQLCVMA
ncbi:MAG: fumarylacetoacetate hydrolase family protein [Burkholderiaceae bacterium]